MCKCVRAIHHDSKQTPRYEVMPCLSVFLPMTSGHADNPQREAWVYPKLECSLLISKQGGTCDSLCHKRPPSLNMLTQHLCLLPQAMKEKLHVTAQQLLPACVIQQQTKIISSSQLPFAHVHLKLLACRWRKYCTHDLPGQHICVLPISNLNYALH